MSKEEMIEQLSSLKEYALSFSNIEDLDERNPELFEFAHTVHHITETIESALNNGDSC